MLAVGLALLTSFQARVWQSEDALWTQAHRIAPETPKPFIGLAWVALRQNKLADAEALLSHGWVLTARQPAIERDWARDAIGATFALILLRQGRLHEASWILAAGPPASERWLLCRHYATVCALASSAPSPRGAIDLW